MLAAFGDGVLDDDAFPGKVPGRPARLAFAAADFLDDALALGHQGHHLPVHLRQVRPQRLDILFLLAHIALYSFPVLV